MTIADYKDQAAPAALTADDKVAARSTADKARKALARLVDVADQIKMQVQGSYNLMTAIADGNETLDGPNACLEVISGLDSQLDDIYAALTKLHKTI